MNQSFVSSQQGLHLCRSFGQAPHAGDSTTLFGEALRFLWLRVEPVEFSDVMLQEFEARVTITRALLERRSFLVGCAPVGVGRADRCSRHAELAAAIERCALVTLA